MIKTKEKQFKASKHSAESINSYRYGTFGSLREGVV
jgi:hypothetical protein